MSGGATTRDDASGACSAAVDQALNQLDQEMKEEAPATERQRSATNGPRNDTAWSFVQMNMTLLPIARPLPVQISNRVHEALSGYKPRTPTQKLHHRVLRNASNISPRRNEDGMLRRRGSTSSESGALGHVIPRQPITERQYSAPTSIQTHCGKRKTEYDDHYLPLNWAASNGLVEEIGAVRIRSHSEDFTSRCGSPVSSGSESPHETLLKNRSASASSGFTRRIALFKDKRILELQDEERRLLPDERATLPSPSKRSRRQ